MPNYLSQAKAVIFDCDGVLVDSETLSCGALNTIFMNNFRIDIGTDYSSIIGKKLSESIKYYLDKYNIREYNLNKLMQEKELAYRESAKFALKTFPHAVKVLKLLKESKRLAIASSGSLEKINFSTNKVGIRSYFDVVASADEVKRGKPSPDVFLLACERLGLQARECVVIEDSLNGAIAAQKGGFPVYGFPGSFSETEFQKLGISFLSNKYLSLQKLLSI